MTLKFLQRIEVTDLGTEISAWRDVDLSILLRNIAVAGGLEYARQLGVCWQRTRNDWSPNTQGIAAP